MTRLPQSKIIEELLELIHKEVDTSKINVIDVAIGVFYTGVMLDTGHGGVAFTPIRDIPDAVCCPRSYGKMPRSGYLSEQPFENILDAATDPGPLKSAVGVAAINAVSQQILFGNGKYQITYDADPLYSVDLQSTDVVAMIGAFTPYIKYLVGKVRELFVIERNPSAASGDIPIYTEEKGKEQIPNADVVVVSGAAIVNHTIDEILSMASRAREIILSGATSSMVPDPLFKRGVTSVGGVRIDDANQMLRVIKQAGSGYSLLKECATKTLLRYPNSRVR